MTDDPRLLTAVPLELHLPNGRAKLIAGSFQAGHPQYERDGVVLDIDVTIPDDLAPSWFWQGSFLRLTVDGCGVAIYTGAFPPPLCFDNARELGRLRAELDAAPKKVVKGVKQPLVLPTETVPEPELIYEQVSF